MRRQLFAAALFIFAPVGCKSVEVAVDYPGMHLAATFEAHDKQPAVASHDAPAANKSAAKKKADKQSTAAAADPRPSITVTL
jgi:hypothetical protein